MAEAMDPGGPSPPSVEDAGAAVNGAPGALEGLGDGDGNDTWENPTVSDGFAPKMALGFPDRREERNRCGLIRFKLENGVPDVGGLGWRSRAGHLLKNQTFFASRPGENQWNNPTHAGCWVWVLGRLTLHRSSLELVGGIEKPKDLLLVPCLC